MKHPFTVITMLLLAGCASYKDYYNPSNLGDESLAVIESEDVGAWVGDYEILASLVRIFNAEGEVVAEGDFWKGDPRKVELTPGLYQVVVRCDGRGLYNFHPINISLKAGEHYTAYCLGQYSEPGLFNRLRGMQGFVSENSVFKAEAKKNQEFVDSIDMSQ